MMLPATIEVADQKPIFLASEEVDIKREDIKKASCFAEGFKIVFVFWFQPEYANRRIPPARIQVFPGRLTGTEGFWIPEMW